MTEPPTGPAGIVTVTYTDGRPLNLGDLRRFVALMDAEGASDSAVVMVRAAPRVRPMRPEAAMSAGLTDLLVLWGTPRASRGPVPAHTP